MPIKRYVATKDTTITDAFKPNLVDRAYKANMGASDSLEVFSIYAQATDTSIERSRILVEFPIGDIANDRTSTKIPVSGSVNFYLKMYNVVHPLSVPKDYTMNVAPLSQSWEEGYGLDMESYSDNGYWTGSVNGAGANWYYRAKDTTWNDEGASYFSSSQDIYSQYFKTGLEDIEIDVTKTVEEWLSNSKNNNGFIVFLSSSYENGNYYRSFYTKKFSARGTQYYFKKPIIEARWNTSIKDDRNNFYASSSALESSDNIMNLYYYNKVKGNLKNIVGNIIPSIKFYTDNNYSNEVTASYNVVTNPSTGVYRAEVAIDTTASVLYDTWVSSSQRYFSSSFDVIQIQNYDYDYQPEYVLNITNLKSSYKSDENTRFKIFARQKDWQPTIYTVAYNTIENTQLQNLYYKIFRLSDNYTVLDYSTGSIAYTKTSYDSNGNFFDLDMTILEKDYAYGIKLATYDGNELKEFSNLFKFRVE